MSGLHERLGRERAALDLRGSGGLLSTASDLLTWFDALSAGRVLGRHSVAALRGRHVDETLGRDETGVEFYGYGWLTREVPPLGAVHWHGGANGYFRAFVAQAAAEDMIVITLANDSNEASERLADDLGRAVLESAA